MLSNYSETPVFANIMMLAASCPPSLHLFCSRICAYMHIHTCRMGYYLPIKVTSLLFTPTCPELLSGALTKGNEEPVSVLAAS